MSKISADKYLNDIDNIIKSKQFLDNNEIISMDLFFKRTINDMIIFGRVKTFTDNQGNITRINPMTDEFYKS